MRRMIACALGGALFLLSSTSLAAPPGPCEEGGKPRVRTVRGPDGRLQMVMQDPLIICGKRHRPQAFYVLQRSGGSYRTEALHRSFLPGIDEVVRRAPF